MTTRNTMAMPDQSSEHLQQVFRRCSAGVSHLPMMNFVLCLGIN